MLKNILQQEEGVSVDAPSHLCDYLRRYVQCQRRGHQCTQCTTEVTEKKAQLYHDLRRYYLSQDWGSSSFAARAHASFE